MFSSCLYRQERDRMLRGFDEDMRMVESEREGMRLELEQLSLSLSS